MQFTPTIDARGADPAVIRRLSASLPRLNINQTGVTDMIAIDKLKQKRAAFIQQRDQALANLNMMAGATAAMDELIAEAVAEDVRQKAEAAAAEAAAEFAARQSGLDVGGLEERLRPEMVPVTTSDETTASV